MVTSCQITQSVFLNILWKLPILLCWWCST